MLNNGYGHSILLVLLELSVGADARNAGEDR